MDAKNQPTPDYANPFLAKQTDLPLVALRGKRNGYLTIAPSREILRYELLPDSILRAAKNWAARLEKLGSPRAYWVTLSEQMPHLHIHIFPRWPEDTLKGIPLFETRNANEQPAWSPEVIQALADWAREYEVAVVDESGKP